jgi:conjugal transfer pilus assembly protein TraE
MELNLKHKKIGSILFQRNFLGGLALALLIIALLQTALLFVKNEKIIILPPELKQEFWIEGNKFAPTYLEEKGMYFTHLLLDVSSSNILSQGEVLLRYVDPSFHEQFKTRLFAEEQRLKRDNVSLNFTVTDCEVYPSELELDITGDLHAYVAFKKISTHRETYRLEFSAKRGRLFLKKFEILKSDNKDLSLPQGLEINLEPLADVNSQEQVVVSESHLLTSASSTETK